MNPQILEMIDELEKNGQGAQIVPLLVRYIHQTPNDAEAWYALSKYLPEPERRLECLDRALRLDPKHEEARLAREIMANEDSPRPEAPAEPVQSPLRPVESPLPSPKSPTNFLSLFKNDKSNIRKISVKKGNEVGAILESLGADYRVWHDVPGKHGNIDHVVLSKKGQLFMIETKAHGGRVRVKGSTLYVNNGEPEQDMIGQCLCNLYDLRELVQEITGISAWVTGYLVFTQAFVEPCKPVSNIRIINMKYLKRGIEEMAANGQGHYELWSDAGALDEAFSKENKTYGEFGKKNFARVSGWGES